MHVAYNGSLALLRVSESVQAEDFGLVRMSELIAHFYRLRARALRDIGSPLEVLFELRAAQSFAPTDTALYRQFEFAVRKRRVDLQHSDVPCDQVWRGGRESGAERPWSYPRTATESATPCRVARCYLATAALCVLAPHCRQYAPTSYLHIGAGS